MSPGPRILVVTIVHRPDDARILHRQIATLRTEGFIVTFAAPWSATGVVPPAGLEIRELPRASGRDRLLAVLAARDLLRREGPLHDLVLIHDPELLLAVRLAGMKRLPPVVWDVHEDTAAALGDRPWVPRPLRGPVAMLVRRLERWAEGATCILLAEDGYRDRFSRLHPVIRNHPPARRTSVPATRPAPDGPPRVVYVGRISVGRGLRTMIELGSDLADVARVELAGQVDADVRGELEDAVARGVLVWHGFVPNDRVGELLEGAAVGLSLLADDPNYRVSMPSKIIEYLAHGVPTVTTPLPAAVTLIEEEGGGMVVPFDDPAATAHAVRRILEEPGLRRALAEQGLEAARRRTWEVEGARMVAMLRMWAA